MWAIAKRPILNSEACQQLEARRRLCSFQSNTWLLPSHLHVLKLKTRAQSSKLMLPAEHFMEASPRAFLASEMPPRLMSTIAECAPLLTVPGQLPMIFDVTDSGTYFWRLSTMDEFLDASFVSGEICYPHNWLLCSCKVIPWLGGRPQLLTILNAQETTNPFLIDPLLEHVSLKDGKPLPKSLSSGLTTVAAQFGYLSFSWLEACEASSVVESGVAPHSILVHEEMRLFHISQLSIEAQRTIAKKVPRFVLFRSAVTPFVFVAGKGWISSVRLQLTEKISRSDVPCSASRGTCQPLLWIADNADDTIAKSGTCLVRYSCSYRLFFNVSQLKTSDLFH